MKAILEFDMEDPEERINHYNAVNGYNYRRVVQEIDNHLRNKLKYADLNEDVNHALQEVRDELIGLAVMMEVDIHE